MPLAAGGSFTGNAECGLRGGCWQSRPGFSYKQCQLPGKGDEQEIMLPRRFANSAGGEPIGPLRGVFFARRRPAGGEVRVVDATDAGEAEAQSFHD